LAKKLQAVDKTERFYFAVDMLDLHSVLEREIGQLSGGEL